MPITGDPNAVAVVTFKAAPLSMGDCFIKIIPAPDRTAYEVTGQFAAIDSAHPFIITPAIRAEAEDWLADVVAAAGGLANYQEIDGPLGKRLVLEAGYTPGDLVNPFSGKTYSGLSLIEVSSEDSGGKVFNVTYTFIKPTSVANDGTTASTILFNSTQIGNRGGKASISADASTLKITATSQYTGANPLNYFVTLCNTLGLEQASIDPLPRGAATNRAAIRSYNSIIGTFEWVGKGTIATAVLESMSYSEETPGIFTIDTSFVASR
jgi:hypothetical protein